MENNLDKPWELGPPVLETHNPDRLIQISTVGSLDFLRNLLDLLILDILNFSFVSLNASDWLFKGYLFNTSVD